jgi:two-component system, cell cycle response regulator
MPRWQYGGRWPAACAVAGPPAEPESGSRPHQLAAVPDSPAGGRHDRGPSPTQPSPTQPAPDPPAPPAAVPDHAAPDPGQADHLVAELDGLEPLTFFDPDATVEPAAAIERAATGLGMVTLQLRAQLIQADVMIRTGQTAAGGRVAREIHEWAADNDNQRLLARSHRVMSLFFSYVGDHAQSLENAVRCLELLDDDASGALRVDHLIALATALAESGAIADAKGRLAAAEQIAAPLDDIKWRLAVLNTQAWVATDGGETQLSLETARRMQALAAAHGVALQATELETLARSLVESGRYTEGEETLLPMIDGRVVSEEGNGLAYCLLTMAQSQTLRGDTSAALETLKRCRDVCDERDLAGIKLQTDQHMAELYARQGRFEEAYEQHKRFYESAQALRSSERAARALTVQAVFETTEARRDSHRFEQLALHDPLTALYNRRFVDDRLPGLLHRAAETGRPLSVGLVDLDHFKVINDTFSHQVGDEVLATVALVLEAAVTEPAFVARLGGEEFLIVLPDTDAVTAAGCFEALRLAVRSHRWDAIAPIGRITVSVGATTTTASGAVITQSSLLGLADHNLYRAKRGGRDCVVGDGDQDLTSVA